MENTKKCSKCGRELPLECFGKNKSKKDGLMCCCKECKKQWYTDNREHLKQYMKQWRADNPQYNKQYRATIDGYARSIRHHNLQEDRKYGRIGKDEDPLPTIEQYIELLQQLDFYDGKQYPFNEMGLDRINNAKPHTLDNVVPCSTAHNRQRHTKTFEEFCELMKIKKGLTSPS